MNILVINSGSSSVKYKLFDMNNEKELAKGIVERIGLKGRDRAIRLILGHLTDKRNGVIKDISGLGAVGHRVVHGGEEFSGSTIITPRVIKVIRFYFKLAPLHNPPNLAAVKAAQKLLPGIKHVAVFDTAFHQTIPPSAYLYALPYRFYGKEKIRKYGFHGTSHKYVSLKAAEILGKPLNKLKLITCHLGNGSSITAVKNGKSINTSMGFTPLEGLVMGTRSGDIDPAIIFYLMNKKNFSADDVDALLNKKSGLLGLSGISSDMRDVYAAVKRGNKRAKLAFEVFIDRIQKYIGAYIVAMNGVDAVVFTAGIGENHAATRRAVCRKLAFLGSRVKVLVVPTDEELMIARETYRLVK